MKKWSKRLALSFTLLLIGSMLLSSGAAVIAETTTEPETEENQLIKSPEESLPEAPPVLDTPETTNEEMGTSETSEAPVKAQEPQEASEETEPSVKAVEETQEPTETTESDKKQDKAMNRLAPKNTGTGDFTVEGGALITDYTYANHVLTFISSGEYTVSGNTTEDRIVVAAANVTLTLAGVSIDVSTNPYQAALLIERNATATIDLVGENVLKSGEWCAGLQNNNQAEDSLVIISGNGTNEGYAGSLAATGGGHSAGIGFENGRSGTVTIEGGKVTATGGEAGAGIGGGESGSGTVTIEGGAVTATGGAWGAGIGCGAGGVGARSVSVTIEGGKVTATGGISSVGIGDGAGGIDTVTIDGGTVKALDSNGVLDSINPKPKNSSLEDVALCNLIPSQENAKVIVDVVDYNVAGAHENDDKYYLYLTKADHEITVKTTDGQQKYAVRWDGNTNKFTWNSDFEVDNNQGVSYTNNELILAGNDQTYHISMRAGVTTTTKDRIKVTGKNVIVKLNDVKIDVPANNNQAAILIDTNATATIDLVGTNELKSGYECAGLQSNNQTEDSLVITSVSGTNEGYAGSLVATGGDHSAGIGCGYGSSGTVSIEGGKVTATGGIYGAGIGGGDIGSGTVRIAGGKVTGTGGDGGAGIGGGSGGSGKVTIEGGTVNAIGGIHGAGIGGGFDGNGTVTIDGGSVKALDNKGVVDSINPKPINSSSKDVALCNLIPFQNAAKVLVDNLDYKVAGQHKDDDKYYLYLTKENHKITVGSNAQSKDYYVYWDNQADKFILWNAEIVPDHFTDVTYANNEVILGGDNQTYNVTMRDGVTTTKKDRIKVTGKNVTVKLNDVKIDVSANNNQAAILIDTTATATIDLVGTNILKSGEWCAGLQNNNQAEDSLVIISGNGTNEGYAGSLTATGGDQGAGIGSGAHGSGTVSIEGGKVTATGRANGAGIGGGMGGSGTVSIEGGKVTTTGGFQGSGIGGGKFGSGTVTIEGGTVTATGGDDSAGIGRGLGGSTGKVTITSGSVKALSDNGAINSIFPSPVDQQDTPLELYQADATSYTDTDPLKVGTTDWKVNGKHPDDENFYLYLPKKKHVVTVGDTESFIEWKDSQFMPASTYTLTIPRSVILDETPKKEQVRLTNEFSQVPGYNKQVTARLSANGMTGRNLILKNQGDDTKQAHSLITYEELTLPVNSTTGETDLIFASPVGTTGNDSLQAGTYKGTLIFETELSDEEVGP